MKNLFVFIISLFLLAFFVPYSFSSNSDPPVEYSYSYDEQVPVISIENAYTCMYVTHNRYGGAAMLGPGEISGGANFNNYLLFSNLDKTNNLGSRLQYSMIGYSMWTWG